MATLTEKLQFILTADASSAIKGFKQVEGSADKALAKTEAGTSKGMAAFQKYGAMAGSIGVIAGGALLKAVDAFNDLALSAGKFSQATGLSVEAASRWIEVAGDLGIEAGTVETAVGRMSRTLAASPEKFADLGVAIARTSDGATDMNATFLNAISAVNKIKDPIARAELAAKLFGKGWQSMAELIGAGAEDLAAKLAEVSDAQVIDEKELAKAKRYRDSMDRLKDSVGDVVKTIGEEATPTIAAFADTLAFAAENSGGLIKALTYSPLSTVVSAFKDIEGALAPGVRAFEEVEVALTGAELATKSLADQQVIAVQSSDTLGVALYGVADAARETDDAIGDADRALQNMIDTALNAKFGPAAQAFIDATKRFADPTGFINERLLTVMIEPLIDEKKYAEAVAKLEMLEQLRRVPFEAVINTTRLGALAPDGGLDPKAVAVATKKAQKQGLMPQ